MYICINENSWQQNKDSGKVSVHGLNEDFLRIWADVWLIEREDVVITGEMDRTGDISHKRDRWLCSCTDTVSRDPLFIVYRTGK